LSQHSVATISILGIWKDGPLWLASELVKQYRHTVNGPAALEVGLEIFGRCRVVDVADKHASVVDIFLVLRQVLARLFERRLHLSELRCLSLHLGNAPLHGRNIFLIG
jgi:hypothetical protein